MGIRDDIEAAAKQLAEDDTGGGASPPAGQAGDAVVLEGAGNETGAPAKQGGHGEAVEGDKPVPARDSTGRFAKGEKAEAPSVTAKPDPKESAVDPKAAGAKPPAAEVAPSAPELRAPQAWKPAVREKWNALPPEIRAEVVRVENETKAALRETAEARRVHQEFQRTVAPFEAMIRAEGGEPLKAVGSLLQTAAALRTAPPAHKAQLIANMVRSFGVPIEDLDAALTGGGQGQQGQPAQQPGAYRDPRVDQLFATIQQAQQHRAQSLTQSAAKELEAIQQQEFFEDVRADMADIIEVAARRGIALSTKDAYDRAVRLHPEISGVLQQREAAKAAANAQASTQRARAAATSVRSQPSGVAPASDKPRTLRDDILAARDSLSGR